MRRVLIALSTLSVMASVVVSPPAAAALADADVELTSIGAFSQPVAMAVRTGDTSRYFAQQGGQIIELRADTSRVTILDISSIITASGERGLLGFTFSPAGDKVYVYYNDLRRNTVVREYPFTGAPITDPGRILLQMRQPYSNHNGGNIAFGPDGYLYIGKGDGGSANDPKERARNLRSLLGKMLRIDPAPSATRPYTIPSDNPFMHRKKARKIIWARGLRNPWRWSFDKTTGDLWIGDVGQSRREEIDFQAASSDGGENYGWDRMEGTLRHEGKVPKDHHPPVYEYSHADGNCSVTGGYVYRGLEIDDLDGAYVFADYCAGIVRAFMPSDPVGTHRTLVDSGRFIVSFGQDLDGELYVLTPSEVFRLDEDV